MAPSLTTLFLSHRSKDKAVVYVLDRAIRASRARSTRKPKLANKNAKREHHWVNFLRDESSRMMAGDQGAMALAVFE